MKRPRITPLRPAAPIRAKYEARLFALINEMQTSIVHWISAEYRRAEPETVLIARDDSATKRIERALNQLGKRWPSRFAEIAPVLARYFSAAVKDRCDRTLASDLRAGGISVRFTMTAAMRDAFNAIVAENVGLIMSVAEQHLGRVRTVVMQSVAAGRDLASLTEALEKQHGIARRRAKFIALDQNNRATAMLSRVRHLELGIEEADWLHSAGGKHKRIEHVRFSGQRYRIADGHDFGNGEGVVWPGTAIGCKCVPRPIVPGFDD